MSNDCLKCVYCSKKLVTGLHELGDYTTQFSIIELVVRLTPSSVRVREALEWNQKNETLANLFVNITYESFDQVRNVPVLHFFCNFFQRW